MTTMPRDCRSGAIRSTLCERFWRRKRVVPASALQSAKPGRRYRVAGSGSGETAAGNRQGNHVHDASKMKPARPI